MYQKKSGSIALYLVLAVLVLGILFILPKNISAPLYPTATTGTPPMPHSDWQTYAGTQARIRYSIQYPNDWVIDTSQINKKNGELTELSLTKRSYHIFIYWPENYTPTDCNFSDNPNFGKTVINTIDCPGDFTQFTSSTNTFRRLNKPFGVDDVILISWQVYVKNSENNFSTTPLIKYDVPRDYDEKVIQEMDTILSTFNQSELNTSGGVACTMEAKQCPDGSYVGRSGPKCEFAKCP